MCRYILCICIIAFNANAIDFSIEANNIKLISNHYNLIADEIESKNSDYGVVRGISGEIYDISIKAREGMLYKDNIYVPCSFYLSYKGLNIDGKALVYFFKKKNGSAKSVKIQYSEHINILADKLKFVNEDVYLNNVIGSIDLDEHHLQFKADSCSKHSSADQINLNNVKIEVKNKKMLCYADSLTIYLDADHKPYKLYANTGVSVYNNNIKVHTDCIEYDLKSQKLQLFEVKCVADL